MSYLNNLKQAIKREIPLSQNIRYGYDMDFQCQMRIVQLTSSGLPVCRKISVILTQELSVCIIVTLIICTSLSKLFYAIEIVASGYITFSELLSLDVIGVS